MRRTLLAVGLALGLVRCEAPDPQPARRPPARARSTAARLDRFRFASAALGVDKEALVWLPPGYDASDRRYPVVYALHGLGGAPANLARVVPSAAREAELQALVVMVDGDDSFYVDGEAPVDYAACAARPRPFGRTEAAADYCVRRPRYEEYVVADVVAAVDRRYRTSPQASARGLLGFSMGGYGALVLAMRHPDVFSVAVSHAGIAALRVENAADVAAWGRPYEGLIAGVGDHLRSILGSDPQRWREHDPVALARTLRPRAVAILLDCGTEDDFRFQDLARDLHEALTARGIDHGFTLVPGAGHDGAFLRDRLDDGLRFAAGKLVGQRPGP